MDIIIKRLICDVSLLNNSINDNNRLFVRSETTIV